MIAYFTDGDGPAPEDPAELQAEAAHNFAVALSVLGRDDELVRHLSDRLLELARTMMAEPEMILFDEPGAGVNPTERKILADRIRQLVREKNITVLLIGHEMELVMDICDPIVVLDRGKLLTEGTPEQVRNDKRVLEVYLGGTMV